MAGQESLPLRRLKEFQPLNRLTDDQLVLLASRAERRTHGPGQRVLERGVRDGLDFFLVAGKIELESVDGRKTIIEAETEKAQKERAIETCMMLESGQAAEHVQRRCSKRGYV